jgi:ribonuclease P protein component
VYRRGKQFRGDLMVLRTFRTDGPVTRYGFAVGRAVGKAVTRNRVKRRLREAARSLPVESGWDVVVSARERAASAAYSELRDQLCELLSKAKVLKEPGGVG